MKTLTMKEEKQLKAVHEVFRDWPGMAESSVAGRNGEIKVVSRANHN
ncbi:MAG: hypothetical protein OEN50_12360 [Deltaproteobacteria bacterium]|nr:hypothetical protein [Deltaproteobacteria bacterium]